MFFRFFQVTICDNSFKTLQLFLNFFPFSKFRKNVLNISKNIRKFVSRPNVTTTIHNVQILYTPLYKLSVNNNCAHQSGIDEPTKK